MSLFASPTGLPLAARRGGPLLLGRPAELAPPGGGTRAKTFHADFRRAPLRTRSSATVDDPDPLGQPSFRTRIGGGYDAVHATTSYGAEAALDVAARPDYAAAGVLLSRPGETVLRAMPTPPELLDAVGGKPYVSAILTTRGAFSQVYGHFEIRAWLPAGAGAWPAFWMIPDTAPPELDIIEFIGSRPGGYYATLHSDPTAAAQGRTPSYAAPFHVETQRRIAGAVTDTWHWYGVEWTASTVTWFYDRQPVASAPTPGDMTVPMYLVINLAIGSNPFAWFGAPDATTPWPLDYRITDIVAWSPL